MLASDVKYSIRTLCKTPISTLACLLTLAIGIGATTAIFSLIDGVILKPLPFPDAGRLVAIPRIDLQSRRHTYTSMPEFLAYQDEGSSELESIAAYQQRIFSLSRNGAPEQVSGVLATLGFFSTLNVAPVLGRVFNAADTDGTIILSNSLWEQRFQRDPGIIGKVVLLDSQPEVIVGVMPAGFWFPGQKCQLWRLVNSDYYLLKDSRDYHFLTVFGRLRPSATVEQAQAKLAVANGRLATLQPDFNSNHGTIVTSLTTEIFGNVRPLLLTLMGTVVFVLLIVCANIANLQMSRYVYRRNEFAIRLALGASWTRVARLLLIESLILSVVGGILGVGLAFLGIRLALPLNLFSVPVSSGVAIAPAALAFTSLLCIATGLFFGIAPAIQLISSKFAGSLTESARGSSIGRKAWYFQGGLVVVEVAASLTLLIGLMLMIQSFERLSDINTGYDPERLLIATVRLPVVNYPDLTSIQDFQKRIEDRVTQIPGVQSVAATSDNPLVSGFKDSFRISGQPKATVADRQLVAQASVSPGFFATMGIPMRSGREFTSLDRPKTEPVAVINESMARRFWANRDPIGDQIRHGATYAGAKWYRVVGIVSDTRPFIDWEPEPKIFTPFLQVPDSYINALGRPLTFAVRVVPNNITAIPSLREVFTGVDPSLACDVRAMSSTISDSLVQPRFRTILFVILGSIAFWLSILGVYGVVSGMTMRETRSLGIRLALGATRSSILTLVIARGMVITSVGVIIGVVSSLFLTRVLQGFLFEIHPNNPFVFLLAGGALMFATFIAVYIPGRRATTIDPVAALRCD
jgi:putative ABC transport system permease protein